MANDHTRKRKDARKRNAQWESVKTAVSSLLQHRNGRDFLWWLLGETHYGQTPYAHNALATAFACGEHNVGQKLLALMTEVNPEGFLSLLKEKADEQRISDDTSGTYTDDASAIDTGGGDPDDT